MNLNRSEKSELKRAYEEVKNGCERAGCSCYFGKSNYNDFQYSEKVMFTFSNNGGLKIWKSKYMRDQKCYRWFYIIINGWQNKKLDEIMEEIDSMKDEWEMY